MRTSGSHRLTIFLSAILCAWLPSMVSAQTAKTVQLQLVDNSLSLSGELLEAANGQYRVRTPSGVFEAGINDVTCTGGACPAVEPDFEGGAQVNLVSADGNVKITGNIVTVLNGQYVIGHPIAGIIRVDADTVDCSGPGCPAGLRFSNESVEVSSEDQAAQLESERTPQSDSVDTVLTEYFDPLNARISFAGSDTIGLGLLPNLLDDYADTLSASVIKKEISETEAFFRYSGSGGTELTSVYVNATGSGDAVDALETKDAVFGMTSRPMEVDEAQRLTIAGGTELPDSEYETVIALDSIALVTHPSNPLREISMSDVAAIYLGQIDNWSQIGGPDAPITVLSREDGSSTRGVFERVVFAGEEPTLAQRITYPGGDNPEMAAAVKADPNAIAYVGFAYSEGLNRLDLTSSCGITNNATSFAVKAEEYPLARRLYLYSRADNTPTEAERFLQYVLSADADNAVARSNFVNFSVERKPHDLSSSITLLDNPALQSAQQLQLAEQMNSDFTQWDRLSTTLRFRSGSFRLDRKELNDISRLISALAEMPEGTRVAVVGFTDDIGTFEQNLQLSQQRAQSVADSIVEISGERLSNVLFDTKSYSELSPSACNDSALGRAINRRVEIWVQ